MSPIKLKISELFGSCFNRSCAFCSAEQNAHDLLKQDPNNSEIFNLIGDIHYKQNNFDKSVWYYFSSIDRNFDIETLNRLSVNISLLNNNNAAKNILTDLLDYKLIIQ